MSLVLYNTLTRKKEKFVPLQSPHVRMYCCGPTVYDLLHIGNFRGAVVYNCLRLWLEHIGFQVSYYYNLTDVDDKIIAKAQEEGCTSKEISEKYIQEFFKDFQSLKLKPHEGNPKATEFIPEMIHLIESLIQKGMAYTADGNVFYSVRKFKKYGCLSHRKLDDLLEGAKEDVLLSKKDPLDFTLWKKAKPGEPKWDSPWGEGRPGWHIECTAMIHKCLANQIDIHGGGMDLVFPHHENELAQSEGSHSGSYVKYWVHHNMFELEGQKISKSLGTCKTMKSFLKEYNAEIFKYLVLSSHYRSVSEISKNTVYQAVSGLYRIYHALDQAEGLLKKEERSQETNQDFLNQIRNARKDIEYALNDDLNTAKAFSVYFVLIRFFNDRVSKSYLSSSSVKLFLEFFKEYGLIFSLFQEKPRSFLNELDDLLLKECQLNRKDIEQLIQKRDQARRQKDFQKADEYKKMLLAVGVEIQDTSLKTYWKMNPSFFLDKIVLEEQKKN